MRSLRRVLVLSLCCTWTMLQSGCALTNDPRRNDKARYWMAHETADHALRVAGYEINSYHPNYDLEEFGYLWYDKQSGRLHHETLYDFLKITELPGPQRFVVAFDWETGDFFLRSELRSRSNLAALPRNERSPATQSQPGAATPTVP
jgi:hypothetical protein